MDKLREYRLKRPCNSNITLVHFDEINSLINEKFPLSLQGKIELGKVISGTYQIEEGPLFINYNTNETRVIIPLNAEQIKYQIESGTKLKLERLN